VSKTPRRVGDAINFALTDKVHDKRKNKAVSDKYSYSRHDLDSYRSPVSSKRRAEDYYDYEDFKAHRALLVAIIVCGVFWVRSVYLVVRWFFG
jgi:hypothetical protein